MSIYSSPNGSSESSEYEVLGSEEVKKYTGLIPTHFILLVYFITFYYYEFINIQQ